MKLLIRNNRTQCQSVRDGSQANCEPSFTTHCDRYEKIIDCKAVIWLDFSLQILLYGERRDGCRENDGMD